MEYGILLFDSTRAALDAERLLKGKEVRIISTPEQVKATCGFALRYELEQEEQILSDLKQAGLLYEDRVHASGQGLCLNYRKIGEKAE